jgi:DNA-binding IclR family transcriptional regulator
VAAVLDAVAANPTGTQAEIAAAAGVSDRTVRTIRNALQPA